ncbi:MAG: alpha/beta hydrolase [bacterium]|nr:alpha/beta hydrolase [bacterium]
MTSAELAAHIEPININGLKGRMLVLPAPKNKSREIVYVYGHHSSLERWIGVAEDLNQYGAVTVPDLPGFGGMDSFYKIGMKPTLDNMADYLASYVKMRYRRKKVTIIGLSFGFLVITRMLQRYPELGKKIDVLGSFVGFSHRDDFIFSKKRYWLYRIFASFFSFKYSAWLLRNLLFHPMLIRLFYKHSHNAKFTDLDELQAKLATEMEVKLWQTNDVRTHMATSVGMLTVDNCQVRIPRKLWHVGVSGDHFFDNKVVEQHLRIIFDEVDQSMINVTKHAPSVIADKKSNQPFIPKRMRAMLNKVET